MIDGNKILETDAKISAMRLNEKSWVEMIYAIR